MDVNSKQLPRSDFRCLDKRLHREKFFHFGISSYTSSEQIKTEKLIAEKFTAFEYYSQSEPLKLHRDLHKEFLWKGLRTLSSSYASLDASRPWMCYWILHSLDLLGEHCSRETALEIISFLKKCRSPTGGFSGVPGGLAHLAPTYAAVNSLCILGRSVESNDAFEAADRDSMYKFLIRLRSCGGSFRMHDDGEVDIRGVYCAVSVATLLGIVTPELFDFTPQWISSCQTYEGGFAGCPGMEAHGGYSFCGIAALILLGKSNLCDVKSLLRWTSNRQMKFEGGFQGRTNKLVDGCYSFWLGGTFPLIHMALVLQEDSSLSAEHWMFDWRALQEYILICCQHYAGGLLDKPGKPRDYYHTCYCLSGLSVSQHYGGGKLMQSYVIGHTLNELKQTHPLFNVSPEAVLQMTQYFSERAFNPS